MAWWGPFILLHNVQNLWREDSKAEGGFERLETGIMWRLPHSHAGTWMT